jgi:hypothetical protein
VQASKTLMLIVSEELKQSMRVQTMNSDGQITPPTDQFPLLASRQKFSGRRWAGV